MIQKLFLSVALVVLAFTMQAQRPVKAWFNPADTVYGFYTLIEPQAKQVNAVLVLFDGYGGNASNFLNETQIDEEAYKDSILTVCLPTGLRLYADGTIIDLTSLALERILKQYPVAKDRFVFGGFSSGGTIALRYTQLCKEKPANYPVQPRAVFTVDSPLDLADLLRSSKTQLQKNHGGWWLDEARMIVATLEKNLGDPLTNQTAWQQVNPFNEADTSAGNERYLAGVAFRTYHDVDVNWHLQNRRRSIYQTNMLNGSELVSRLLLAGNTEAAFIQSAVHGQRANGQAHPHSWNIVDAAELLKWVKEMFSQRQVR